MRCEECSQTFFPDETNLQPVAVNESSLAPQVVSEESLPPTGAPRDSSNNAFVIFLVVALVVVLGLAVKEHFSSTVREQKFEAAYKEFTFEADQLAHLTNYGINKNEFVKQLARVGAKWDAFPNGSKSFPPGAGSLFHDAVNKWRKVADYWKFDNDYMRGMVPGIMTEAAEAYTLGKATMKNRITK
jgi:hypothetical protein